MGLEEKISRMIWGGGPVPTGGNPTVKNSRFPDKQTGLGETLSHVNPPEAT